MDTYLITTIIIAGLAVILAMVLLIKHKWMPEKEEEKKTPEEYAQEEVDSILVPKEDEETVDIEKEVGND